jgi:hypothetical protein
VADIGLLGVELPDLVTIDIETDDAEMASFDCRLGEGKPDITEAANTDRR